MVSRRDMLRISAGVAAGSLVSGTAPAEAQESQPKSVPPSIQALKSMKEQARPISNDERQLRIDRARQLMAANKIDAILMIGGTSLIYYANIRWWNSERLGALVLPVKGRPYFVAPAFEADRLHEQLSQGPLAEGADVLTWQEDEDPYKLLARGLADRGIRTGNIGIEERTTFVFSDGVAKAAPAMKTVSATPVTAGCRDENGQRHAGHRRMSHAQERPRIATDAAGEPGDMAGLSRGISCAPTGHDAARLRGTDRSGL
jgi:Xaa-Pro dipeptidase